jgi:hypothetical protein
MGNLQLVRHALPVASNRRGLPAPHLRALAGSEAGYQHQQRPSRLLKSAMHHATAPQQGSGRAQLSSHQQRKAVVAGQVLWAAL